MIKFRLRDSQLQKIAERFAAQYINSEQAVGRSPTLRGEATSDGSRKPRT